MKQLYSCIICDDYYCSERNICENAAKCFTSRQREFDGTEIFQRGCIQSEDHINFICSSSYTSKDGALIVECCSGDRCNNDIYPEFVFSEPTLLEIVLYILLATCLFFLAGFFILYILSKKHPRFRKFKEEFLKKLFQKRSRNIHHSNNPFAMVDESNQMLSELTSGSGSGLPLLMQRTLAKNICLEDIIGKGSYGEVWRGVWHGEHVAVKIFKDEGAWERETEVYSSTVLLRHENVLGFFGSDKTCRGSCTQLWLITEYHPNGSLHQYLQSHVLDHMSLYSMSLSFVNGLLHFHTEITGTQGKPGIAHRNINSNNVLVKSDGTCCLSDFSLSVIRIQGSGEISVGNSDRLGATRYLSPEVLEDRMDYDNFESFRQSDIYAAALVLWEICSRSTCQGISECHSKPYSKFCPDEPSLEDMRDIVCGSGQRPPIPSHWRSDPVFRGFERLLRESWSANPQVRLTALRIKKDLIKLFETDSFVDDEQQKLL